MALGGADVLLYPTAIGTEPANPALDTRDRWQRAMVGHAVSNVIPVAAANRIGDEDGQLFYGSSFVAGTDGDILAELGRDERGSASSRSTSPRSAGARVLGLLPRPAPRALRRAADGRRAHLSPGRARSGSGRACHEPDRSGLGARPLLDETAVPRTATEASFARVVCAMTRAAPFPIAHVPRARTASVAKPRPVASGTTE